MKKNPKRNQLQKEMESEWVRIASFYDEVNCQLAIERLAEEGIDAVSIDTRDKVYKVGGGELDLYVHRDYVIIAKETIKDILS
jgi:hypothetical protein